MPVQHDFTAFGGRSQRRPFGVPAPVVLDPGKGRARLAGSDARQQRLLFRLSARIHDGAGGQHRRRKIRRAEQGAPHLLQHNALIAKAKPVAAIGLGNADRCQADRGVDRAPAIAFVALIGRNCRCCSRGSIGGCRGERGGRSWPGELGWRQAVAN